MKNEKKLKIYYYHASYNLMSNTNSYIAKSELFGKHREYLTHDNGARPFLVIAGKNSISIYQNEESTRLIREFSDFSGYWYGFDSNSNQ